MENEHGKEFLVLLAHLKTLFVSVEDKTVLPAKSLLKIRGVIETCDHLEINNAGRRYLLYASLACWEHCLDNWTMSTPPGEENVEIPKLKLKTGEARSSTALVQVSDMADVFDKHINDPENPESSRDRRFLRSIKVATTKKNIDNNEDNSSKKKTAE